MRLKTTTWIIVAGLAVALGFSAGGALGQSCSGTCTPCHNIQEGNLGSQQTSHKCIAITQGCECNGLGVDYCREDHCAGCSGVSGYAEQCLTGDPCNGGGILAMQRIVLRMA